MPYASQSVSLTALSSVSVYSAISPANYPSVAVSLCHSVLCHLCRCKSYSLPCHYPSESLSLHFPVICVTVHHLYNTTFVLSISCTLHSHLWPSMYISYDNIIFFTVYITLTVAMHHVFYPFTYHIAWPFSFHVCVTTTAYLTPYSVICLPVCHSCYPVISVTENHSHYTIICHSQYLCSCVTFATLLSASLNVTLATPSSSSLSFVSPWVLHSLPFHLLQYILLTSPFKSIFSPNTFPLLLPHGLLCVQQRSYINN